MDLYWEQSWYLRDVLGLLRSAHTEFRTFLPLTAAGQRLENKELGGHGGPRGIPQHRASCTCIKMGKEEEEDVQSDEICLPKPPSLMMEPDCPGMAELVPMESQE